MTRVETVLGCLGLAFGVIAAAQLGSDSQPEDSTYLFSAAAVVLTLAVAARRCFQHWRASSARNDGWLWLAGGCTTLIGFCVAVLSVRALNPVPPGNLEADQPHLLAGVGISAFVMVGTGLLRLPWHRERGWLG